jgi:adenosylcobinamide kinase / adenosylcobinamide-phosphate guanylyltransferase
MIRAMRVVMTGTGGSAGWPEPDCHCASCAGAARGNARARSTIVVDDILHLTFAAGGADGGGPLGGGGYRVREVAGGWDVTGPDGRRLLCAGGAGAVPKPPEDAAPYDYAVLDMLHDPGQLGALRRRGLVTESTAVALACADHRAASERELAELCGFWRVQLAGDGDGIKLRRYETKERRVLVVGGARSGKSERAELRVAAEPDVTYVATGPDGAGDPEWAARVAAHRARRPAWWRTVETTDLAGLLAGGGGDGTGTLLIDGIGTWLAATMDQCGVWDGTAGAAGRLAAEVAGLVRAWRETCYRMVAVSDEVGFGLVPETPAGRMFRDELGRLNQYLGRESEMTEFILAGRVIPLPLW